MKERRIKDIVGEERFAAGVEAIRGGSFYGIPFESLTHEELRFALHQAYMASERQSDNLRSFMDFTREARKARERLSSGGPFMNLFG